MPATAIQRALMLDLLRRSGAGAYVPGVGFVDVADVRRDAALADRVAASVGVFPLAWTPADGEGRR
jgi:hypothetical protein